LWNSTALTQNSSTSRIGGWAFAAATAFLSASSIQGQLFSRTTELGTPVVILDPSTGAFQRVAVTGETSYSSVSGLDPEGRRIFVLAAGTPAQRIVTINLSSGAVSSAPLTSFVPDRPLELHFDPASRTVLAVSNSGQVLQINPETGSIQTTVGNFTISSVTAIAFDPVTRRLFAINGETGQTLQILDLDTGQLTSHFIPSVHYYGLLKWDPVTRRLLSATSEPGVPIVSIDPSTGSVVPVVETGSPVLPYQSALDAFGRRLFFLSLVPRPTGGVSWSLYAVDLSNPSVAAIPLDSSTDYLFLQFLPSSTVAVPSLGITGATALVIALALAGALLLGRARIVN
jgi:hypothetical protein